MHAHARASRTALASQGTDRSSGKKGGVWRVVCGVRCGVQCVHVVCGDQSLWRRSIILSSIGSVRRDLPAHIFCSRNRTKLNHPDDLQHSIACVRAEEYILHGKQSADSGSSKLYEVRCVHVSQPTGVRDQHACWSTPLTNRRVG